MNKEKQNIVPEVRFPEFENNWEKVKLKDISKYFNGKSFEGNVQEEGKYELVTLKSIDSSGRLVHSKRYINDEVPTLKKGTLVMILSEQAPGLLGMTAIIPLDNKFVLNQRVAEIRPNDKVVSFFLSMAINRNQRTFSRLGAGMKVQNISKPNVENYKFYYPTLAEQQKIANCLSSLDNIITAETEKLDHLKDHKKGLLQQLFPANGKTKPQFRFPEFVGDGDWVEKKLNEVCDVNPSIKNLPEEFVYIDLESVKSKKLLKKNVIKRDGAPSRAQRLLKNEDVIFQMVRPYQKNNYFFNSDDNLEYVASTGYAQLRAFESKMYLFQFIHNDNFVNRVLDKCTGSNYPAINSSSLSNIKIEIPKNPKEQQKIANCLSSADDLIAAQKIKIEALKKHKKGLMQQLFPNVT